MYPFGQDFTFEFHAYFDNEPVRILTGNPVSIYVFNFQPTRDQVQNGASYSPVETITTWTELDEYTRLIPVSAIDDPDPDSPTVSSVPYWLGVNFRLQTLEQIQTAIRRLELGRVGFLHKLPKVTLVHLKQIYDGVDVYGDEIEIHDCIRAAEDLVEAKLISRGFTKEQIYRADKLELPLKYKALAVWAEGQTGEDFERRRERWDRMSDSLLEAIPLPVDTDGDGSPDPQPALLTNSITLLR